MTETAKGSREDRGRRVRVKMSDENIIHRSGECLKVQDTRLSTCMKSCECPKLAGEQHILSSKLSLYC